MEMSFLPSLVEALSGIGISVLFLIIWEFHQKAVEQSADNYRDADCLQDPLPTDSEAEWAARDEALKEVGAILARERRNAAIFRFSIIVVSTIMIWWIHPIFLITNTALGLCLLWSYRYLDGFLKPSAPSELH